MKEKKNRCNIYEMHTERYCSYNLIETIFIHLENPCYSSFFLWNFL